MPACKICGTNKYHLILDIYCKGCYSETQRDRDGDFDERNRIREKKCKMCRENPIKINNLCAYCHTKKLTQKQNPS